MKPEPFPAGPALVSLVIPVYNESENLKKLHEEATGALARSGVHYEIVFVDDGSTDETASIIAALAEKDAGVTGVSLSRNFGHQAALTAGLDLARGNAVITMDGDLQHPPSLIPLMIQKWKEGYQVVNTIREDTGREPLFKRWTSSLYYKLLSAISDVPILAGAADFRLLDRQVVESLRSIKEHDRFLRGLISWVGFSATSIPFKAGERHGGKTKYSLMKMVRLAIDGVMSFSAAPLRLLLLTGLIVCFFSFLYACYSLYVHFFTHTTVPGWTSLLITVLFLGGVQLIGMGLMGEYLMHVYLETKGRPLYIVKQSFGRRSTSVEKT